MKTKVVISVLAVTVLNFCLGWLLYGIVLAGFYKDHTIAYTGLLKDPPNILAIFVSTFAYACMLIYVLHSIASARTFGKGAVIGLIIGFLMSVSYDLSMYGMMNLYAKRLVLVDIFVGTIMAGLVAGIAAWILGIKKKETE